MSNTTVYARIGNYGQEVYAVEFPRTSEISASDIKFDNIVLKKDRKDVSIAKSTGRVKKTVVSVENREKTAYVEVIPFLYECDFTMTVKGEKIDLKAGEVKTDVYDEFEYCETDTGVSYRLFSPKGAKEARPLILFLHGGGGQGTDNAHHLLECFGGVNIAEAYPWCYVMAPQCHPPKGYVPPTEVKAGPAKPNMVFGWQQDYLAGVCDEIRRMIKEGKVNPKRVYVTGLSMGGAGTLKCLNVASDLFAASVCICPTMGDETYNILKNLTHTKIWVCCSYLDHFIERHKYLTDGVMELNKEGNNDARLTILSQEELAEYGVSADDTLTLSERAAWNHWCWIPVYKNFKGVMSWMLNQYKD